MSTLSAHDIQVRLGGKPVVAGVEASFQSGTVTAILGPNGAGKSTLLACLAGLRKPGAGRVRLDEADVLSMPARAPETEALRFATEKAGWLRAVVAAAAPRARPQAALRTRSPPPWATRPAWPANCAPRSA